MITGYNTDVRHKDVVYHVQTEDKGTNNPCIESLVYVGGQVLAAKRLSYADLVSEGNAANSIVDRMEKQHRTVIAAIRQGKFESKLAPEPSRKRQETDQLDQVLGQLSPETPTEADTPARDRVAHPAPDSASDQAEAQVTEPSMPVVAGPAATETSTSESSTDETAAGVGRTDQTDPAGQAGDPERMSGESVPTPVTDSVQTLDQVILEYLTSEADQEQLLLLVEQASFTLGEHADVSVTTRASKTGSPIRGADVHVRMISTVDEPQVLAKGETDEEGNLALSFEIPQVAGGTAALIISAASDIGRAELKHLL